MSGSPLTIAVTGLNATDNPGPGVAVLRSLRHEAPRGERLVGLSYDALDPGLYAHGLADEVFLLTYPSAGLDAYLDRLRLVHEKTKIDVLIPTLDAELPALIALEPELRAMGIAVYLPSRAQFELRAKANLVALGKRASIAVPPTAILTSVDELASVHQAVPYPFFVKGPFYGATLATCFEEALGAFHRALAAWGGPVIVQAAVRGEEANLVALGDGRGGILGAVAMKKLAVTDKGKGWACVTTRDPALVTLAERIAAATSWRGPFEVEALRDASGNHHLIEINPRFPAWVHLATSAGMNLPRAVVALARGSSPVRLGDYRAGKMFVRISWDQMVELREFESLVTTGEFHHVEHQPHGKEARERQAPL